MKVAITGSSGLIGTALRSALRSQGHTPVPVVRSAPSAGEISWDPAAGVMNPADLVGIDAVVNLAGAGIGDERWTPARKELIISSRVNATTLLATTMAGLDGGPQVLLSGSAIGFYGNRGDEELDETSPAGDGFLPQICLAWEAAAQVAVDAGIRTAFLRTGIVLSDDGGALAKMLLPFKLGVGGRLGRGDQYMSWISIDDEVAAIIHLLTANVSGPVDLTAPAPVTNQTFTKALGRELGRPTLLPIPAIGPRLLLGKELAQALLYDSARVLPTALSASGYQFRHLTIDVALAAILGDQELA